MPQKKTSTKRKTLRKKKPSPASNQSSKNPKARKTHKKPQKKQRQSPEETSIEELAAKAKKASNPFLEIILFGLSEEEKLKELTNNYPEEMLSIFKSRMDMFIREFGLFLEKVGKHIIKTEDQLPSILIKIGHRELNNVITEPKRFHEKFGKNMFETISKAKEGSEPAIIRLIEWDKAWIATPFMAETIILKQQYLNEGFFEALAPAIAKKRTGVSPKDTKEKELFLYIKLLGLICNFKAHGDKRLKKIHMNLATSGQFPEESPLLDFTYFQKCLNRDGIL